METHEIYRAALETFGEEAQTKMLFEEMGELMSAICKHARGRDKVAHVAEEIADVRIMLDQMAILFECEDEVERQRRYKLRRLEQRIEEVQGVSIADLAQTWRRYIASVVEEVSKNG